MKKLVSVVIPVYNVEEYLDECLASVVHQSYTCLDIIVIDDGSTDKSGEICDKYAQQDNRIRVCHKKNEGVSAARNMGIDMALGEYLIFVDSDDMIHENMIEIYMEYISNQYNLVCDITSDYSVWTNLPEKLKNKKMEIVAQKEFMSYFCRDYVNAPFNKIYNLKIIKNNSIYFPVDKNLGEDLYFNLEYYSQSTKDYQIIPYPLYFYRENRTGSLSNVYNTDLFCIQKELFYEIKSFLERADIWNAQNQKIYYTLFFERLYLTTQIYKKNNINYSCVLKDSVWDEVWNECKKRHVLTWKRYMKKWSIELQSKFKDY